MSMSRQLHLLLMVWLWASVEFVKEASFHHLVVDATLPLSDTSHAPQPLSLSTSLSSSSLSSASTSRRFDCKVCGYEYDEAKVGTKWEDLSAEKFKCPVCHEPKLMFNDVTCRSQQPADVDFMKRALNLASIARGHTRPNPVVGCVIVDPFSGNIVGEGYHAKAGMDHAEVMALKQAGEKAKGCTAYVSLEPCNHYGRTPPCTQALIKHGIKRVVAGMVDPDSRVSGQGLETLRTNGVQVEVGVEGRACMELNKAFVHRVKTSHPYSLAGIKIQRNEKDKNDRKLTHKTPSAVEIEEIFPKALPDVDTIVISIDDIQEWTKRDIALSSHIDLIITALDKTYASGEIEQMIEKLLGFGRKMLLVTKVKAVYENTFKNTNVLLHENCCHQSSTIQNKKTMRLEFDEMKDRSIYVKRVEESEAAIQSIFDVLREMQSNAVLHIVKDIDYLTKLRELGHVQELLIFADVEPDVDYVESIVEMIGTKTSQSNSRDIFESFKCTIKDGNLEINALLLKL